MSNATFTYWKSGRQSVGRGTGNGSQVQFRMTAPDMSIAVRDMGDKIAIRSLQAHAARMKEDKAFASSLTRKSAQTQRNKRMKGRVTLPQLKCLEGADDGEKD